jgi:hypothetical protein
MLEWLRHAKGMDEKRKPKNKYADVNVQIYQIVAQAINEKQEPPPS